MPTQLFVNNFSTSLSASALSTDIVLYLTSVVGLPDISSSDSFSLTIKRGTSSAVEIVTVSSIDIPGKSVTVTRGSESTTAINFNAGDIVEMRVTAHSLSNHPIYDTVADMVASVGTRMGQFIGVKDYATGNNSGVLFFTVVAAGTGVADDGEYIDSVGAPTVQFKQNFPAQVTARMFGAAGNYTNDDTSSIDNAALYSSATGETIDLGDGVYRYTGTLTIPAGASFIGNSAPRIAAYPQYGGDKSKLRPTYKSTISGASIIFDGTGATTTYTTNRSDKFSSVTPMVTYLHDAPYSIKNVAFIQDMDVFDLGGTLTTAANDNRATVYTAGMVDQSTLSVTESFVIFGYFDDAGYIIHNQDGGNLDPDYITHNSGLFTGGVAIIGHDTAAGAATEGLTGGKFPNCGIYGADHHYRPDGIYTVSALYIDGFLSAGDSGIRGHHFNGANFRTYANNAISLDHCDDISMIGCTYEFSVLAGVTNADAAGTIVGTANTGDIRIMAPEATAAIGIETLASTIAGSLLAFGADNDQDVIIADAGKGIRIRGSGDDSVIQLTSDFSSGVSDWTIVRDSSDADEFELRYDNVSMFRLATDGDISAARFKGRLSAGTANVTLSANAITVPDGVSYITISNGGAPGNLQTINGNFKEGDILYVRTASNADDITLVDVTGNLRNHGSVNILLDSSQDKAHMVYDGTNFAVGPEWNIG